MKSVPTSHPGQHIREFVVPSGMTVAAASKLLGVSRPTLSNLLNGNAALSPEMATRLEKAFGADAKLLMQKQTAFDQFAAGSRELEIAVRVNAPKVLGIRAIQIEAWADQISARAELAVILRKLVNSTGPSLTRVDFPAHEKSQRHGWDGFVSSSSATPWVPSGDSGWEFGCDQRPAVKAQHDYEARTEQVARPARRELAFVFVTPRSWPGKDAWAAARKAEGEWRDVRAFDSSDLEQWLEQSIPAQAWFADRLQWSGVDIQPLEKAWSHWATVTRVPLAKELFAKSVELHAGRLAEWLGSSPLRPFTVVAESQDEALAFLACAFESPPLAEGHADRAVIVKSPEALAKIGEFSNSLIAVIASPDAERQSEGIHQRQHTIVVTRRNAVEGEPDITLDLVDDATFRTALRKMGRGDEEIDQLGRESGHSLTVLRRRLSDFPAIRTPPWSEDTALARRLIGLMFVGAWDSACEADQAVIVAATGDNSEVVERTVAGLVGSSDSPVWSIGRFRGIVSKVDTFYAVQRLIIADDLSQFFKVAGEVLGETDPALDLPRDKRWASNIYGKARKHSAALRQGVCETLVLLAVHGDNLFGSRIGRNTAAQVSVLVRGLLLPLDPTKWLSQQTDLPQYAEAAPEVFLDILETDLASSDPKVLALMEPAGAQPFSGCPRTGLLWALENLAWYPQWLPRVVAVLAKLASVTITDNWSNTPANTLKSIFRHWLPQTAASSDDRVSALELLVRKNREAGWAICIDQFDPNATMGHFSSKPRWRPGAAGAGLSVTRAEALATVRKAFDLAINWESHDENTLGDIVDRLRGIPVKEQAQVWSAIQMWAKSNPADGCKAALRERIRVRTMTRRSQKFDWAPRTSEKAKTAYEMLLPTDLVQRNRWLFAKQWVEESADQLADGHFDFRKRDERISAMRREALREVWGQSGYEGVKQLCTMGDGGGTVGVNLAEVLEDEDAKRFIIALISDEADEGRVAMNWCLATFVRRREQTGRHALVQLLLHVFDGDPATRASRTLRLLMHAPFNSKTWALVDTLGAKERRAYWIEVGPYWAQQTPEEVNRIVRELLDVDRPRAAFRAVEMEFQNVDSDLLHRLLFEVATKATEPDGHYRLDAHYISEALKVLSSRADATSDERARDGLARLEFLYIEALDHTEHGLRNLERQLSRSPELFAQALVFSFKRNDDGDDPPEWRAPNEKSAANAASSAYTLLGHAKRIPGTKDDGSIDEKKLREWVARARALAAQHGRQEVGDSMIGRLLSQSPAGADGIWPCEPVREVLEDLGTPDIARGMSLGVYNSRGAVWRGEGGNQERELTTKYRSWARALATRYPFVGRMLDELAEMYVREAVWHDDEAKIRRRLSH